jgi:hypothetical protein
MKRIICIFLLLTIMLAACSTQKTLPETSSEQNIEVKDNTPPIEEKDTILEKVQDTFSSTTQKIENKFKRLNDGDETFFTDVDISKSGKDIVLKFTITPNVTSKMFLNLLTLSASVFTYEETQDFDNLKFTYLDSKNKQLGVMTIPKKAIQDVSEFSTSNPDKDFEDNPYVEAFWSISSIMYDESVPELFPTSLTDDMFGDFANDDTDDIAEALSKKVTHLEIECGYSDNWDADADDDGITWYLKPLSADETIVPIEGSFEVKGYEKVQADDWGFEYEQGKQVYTRTDELKGEERLQYFSLWDGYKISLDWENVDSYMASSSDQGILFVTYTDMEGNNFEAKTGEGSYDGCQLRES